MNGKLIELRTKRLRVLCLELEDMLLLNKGNTEAQFEKKMGYSIGKLDDFDKELNKEFCAAALKDEENRLWFRQWDFVSLKENKLIGGALFKGGPNKNGEVEIGYGIKDEFQCLGYATESIVAMIQWALGQQGVSTVIAETDKDNIASQKVLQHSGMAKYSETDVHYLWKYQV